METINFQGETIYRFGVGSSSFLVHPQRGARLMNWSVGMADGSVRDVIHWPEDGDLTKIAKVRGGNPILFPFSARTFLEGKLGKWKDGDGRVRPMPIHGFARDGQFELSRVEEQGFTAVLIPQEKDAEAYPFNYEFSVSYYFSELFFSVDLKLKNLGQERIPWSAGHHFYFNVPWHEDLRRGDYRVKMSPKKSFYQSDDGKLVPVKLSGEEFGLADEKMLDRIHTHLKSNTVLLGPRSGEEDISIQVGQSPVPAAWSTLVTWTQEADSPFYCVEPWMGPPNALEHEKGLHWVDAGDTDVFSVKVSLV